MGLEVADDRVHIADNVPTLLARIERNNGRPLVVPPKPLHVGMQIGPRSRVQEDSATVSYIDNTLQGRCGLVLLAAVHGNRGRRCRAPRSA